jgi:hypothetical protein
MGILGYGSYGFRPINNYDYNKILIKKYNDNQLTIIEANILKYIKMTTNDEIMKAVKKIPYGAIKNFSCGKNNREGFTRSTGIPHEKRTIAEAFSKLRLTHS